MASNQGPEVVIGKGSTKFTYDGQDVLMDDDLVSGITKYQNGPGIDNKLRATTGSNTSYFVADHLGSTNGLTNASGALTASNSYDSFGNPTNASFPSRYQFTGREFDSFSGLQYSRARFYDPKIGRFMSEDPIGLAGGSNLYGYVGNNPQRFTDPMGLFPFLPFPSSYDPFPYNNGKEAADAWDAAVDAIRDAVGIDPPIGVNPLNPSRPYTLSEAVSGLADPLRVGDGIGCAIFIEDENGWGRAAFALMDVQRSAAIASTVGGLGTRFVPKSPTGFNPFKGKTAPEIEAMLKNKGYTPMGPDPLNGKGSYLNPKTGRSYHIDANHPPPKPPHIGVSRPRNKRGSMKSRDFDL